MARALVTGAAGFVGSNLVRRLLGDGHEVHLMLREGRPDWRWMGIKRLAAVHFAPLNDEERVRRVVREIRAQWIFHLAAYGAYSSQTDPLRILQTNVMGTANLLQACIETGFEAFVNTGSSSEYGFKDHAPSESEALEPNSVYAVGKASATLLCSHMAKSTGLRIPTLRLYSVFGPFEEPTRLIPTLIVNGLENRLPPLVSPEIGRDFVYTEDVVDAYLLAATTQTPEPGAVCNVGTGIQTTIGEAVACAREHLGVSSEPQWASLPDRVWDTTTWVCDNRKIRQQLGWVPTYTFERGFQATVEWLRSDERLLTRYRERVVG